MAYPHIVRPASECPALGARVKLLTTLSLSFPICKTGRTIVPTSKMVEGIKRDALDVWHIVAQ